MVCPFCRLITWSYLCRLWTSNRKYLTRCLSRKLPELTVRWCLLSFELKLDVATTAGFKPKPELQVAITAGLEELAAYLFPLSPSSPSLLLPWRVCPLLLFSVSLPLLASITMQAALFVPRPIWLLSHPFLPSLPFFSILPQAFFSLLVLPVVSFFVALVASLSFPSIANFWLWFFNMPPQPLTAFSFPEHDQ